MTILYTHVVIPQNKYEPFHHFRESAGCPLPGVPAPTLTQVSLSDFCHDRWRLAYSWISYNEIVQYVLFYVWLLVSHILYLRFIHVLCLFLPPAVWCSIQWIFHHLFICSPADELLGCFHCLANGNQACVKVLIPICLWIQVSISLEMEASIKS